MNQRGKGGGGGGGGGLCKCTCVCVCVCVCLHFLVIEELRASLNRFEGQTKEQHEES